jgi:hypothetical protein
LLEPNEGYSEEDERIGGRLRWWWREAEALVDVLAVETWEGGIGRVVVVVVVVGLSSGKEEGQWRQ